MQSPSNETDQKTKLLYVQDQADSSEELAEGILNDRDMELLSMLYEAKDGNEANGLSLSFQGIRRKLGIHQETLSRGLKRLTEDGLVQKIGTEYALSRKGNQILSRHLGLGRTKTKLQSVPILNSLIPTGLTNENIELKLAHKWFGNLRWLGSHRDRDSLFMTWTTPDGKLSLTLKLSKGYLTIESTMENDKESVYDAIQAAYDITRHVSSSFHEPDPVTIQHGSGRTFAA
jgi:DNA-binding Lrp family transcriptional regulator